MGVESEDIRGGEFESLGIDVTNKPTKGPYKLKIPDSSIKSYKNLVRMKLVPGYWNEFIGEKEIGFIFKFDDGTIKEYTLSSTNESEIGKLCAQFNNEDPKDTEIVYKYLSENDFYRDFMQKYYSHQIGEAGR